MWLSLLLLTVLAIALAPVAAASSSSSSSSSRPPSSPGGGVDLGTTIVAIRYREDALGNGATGIAVAADTRTSTGEGSFVSHRYAHKIVPLSPYCLLCRSGSAADTQVLAGHVRRIYRGRMYQYGQHLTVSQLAHCLRYVLYENNNNMQASLILAGCDPHLGQAEIFSLAPSGALVRCENNNDDNNYAASGSGSTFITGFLDHKLQQQRHLPNRQEAIGLCQEAVRLACQRDGASGGLIRVYTVDNEHGIREEPPIRAAAAATAIPPQAARNTNNNGGDYDPQSTTILPGFADKSSM